MANSLLTIDMITRKTLEIFENNLVISRNVNRQYDDSFASGGAKIGSNLRIRLPDRALVTDGAALQVQDDAEQYVNLPLATQKHIGVNFTTAELTMQLDEFAERVLKPRVSQLASSVDADVANCYKDIYNSVGTPGTVPGTSLVLLQANQKLNEMAVPLDPRYATVSPAANAGLVEGMKGFFNPTGAISSQFKSGMMGSNVLGLNEIAMSQSITSHTEAAEIVVAPIVATTVATQGQATLAISFTSGSPTFTKGDVFTIGSVYAVNPQTRVSTGSLQQFVVTADLVISSTTTGTLAISPPLYTAAHALATVNSFPQSSAVLTFMGAAAGVYPQNLVYHKDAIAMVTADLIMPQGVDMASRQVHNGISMRVVRQYDINNDRMPCRIDVLYGYATIRARAACRVWG